MIGWAACTLHHYRWTDRPSGRYSLSLRPSVCGFSEPFRYSRPLSRSVPMLPSTALLPPFALNPLSLPTLSPFLWPLRNYKHSFHTKSSQHRLPDRSKRVPRESHFYYRLLPNSLPLPSHLTTRSAVPSSTSPSVSQWLTLQPFSKFSWLQAIVRSRRKDICRHDCTRPKKGH